MHARYSLWPQPRLRNRNFIKWLFGVLFRTLYKTTKLRKILRTGITKRTKFSMKRRNLGKKLWLQYDVRHSLLTCIGSVTLVSVTVSSIIDAASSLQIDRLQILSLDKAVRNIGKSCSNIDDLVALCRNDKVSSRACTHFVSTLVNTSSTAIDT